MREFGNRSPDTGRDQELAQTFSTIEITPPPPPPVGCEGPKVTCVQTPALGQAPKRAAALAALPPLR